jgi:membrane protein
MSSPSRTPGPSPAGAADAGVLPARRPGARDLWPLLRDTVTQWNAHDASRLAASLACYTLLSVAPLVILSVALAGLAFGDKAARGEVAAQIGSVVGASAASAIEAIVANAHAPSSSHVGAIVGFVVLIFGASGVFNELQSALNTIWGVASRPGRGLLGLVRSRFFSFAMVVVVAFLLLASLLVTAALEAAGKFFAHSLPGGASLWLVANFLVSLAITTLLFALVFKVVPEAVIHWRDVIVGAAVTSALFALGKWLVGLYIGRSSFTSAFGAAGSLVALVVWVYYSSQIVFLGAEFTQVYARRFGGRIQPREGAVAVRPGGTAISA